MHSHVTRRPKMYDDYPKNTGITVISGHHFIASTHFQHTTNHVSDNNDEDVTFDAWLRECQAS